VQTASDSRERPWLWRTKLSGQISRVWRLARPLARFRVVQFVARAAECTLLTVDARHLPAASRTGRFSSGVSRVSTVPRSVALWMPPTCSKDSADTNHHWHCRVSAPFAQAGRCSIQILCLLQPTWEPARVLPARFRRAHLVYRGEWHRFISGLGAACPLSCALTSRFLCRRNPENSSLCALMLHKLFDTLYQDRGPDFQVAARSGERT
jgi:hypothetical protein